MKDSEVLREARESVANQEFSHICFALRGDSEHLESLRHWVDDMLGCGCTTYECWLVTHHKDFYHTICAKGRDSGKNFHDICRPGRLAWLDWMIAYCEKQESAI